MRFWWSGGTSKNDHCATLEHLKAAKLCCCNAEQITNAAPKSAGNRQAGICRTNAEAATPENRHFSNIQCDYFPHPF